MNNKDIPVLLINGYLGSGKTTLLNYILANEEGIRFAVIVNDIGAINIDAELIQREGVVHQGDAGLVALQNGCICCTLQNDLVAQIYELMRMECFDYIVIEASGICNPAPVARTLCTIPMLGQRYNQYGQLRLDCVATVVDALRMKTEFDCAKDLTADLIEEEDIKHLLIQQIEFCNLVILNKVSEVSADDLREIRQMIRVLQPKAEILECDYAQIALQKLISTRNFDYRSVAASAGWIHVMDKPMDQHEEESHDVSCTGLGCQMEGHHHHHHHHHHGEGEVEEYGIGTFVYYNRRPFSQEKFNQYIYSHYPKQLIRAKGFCYFSEDPALSYVFEQSGSQRQLAVLGPWYAAMDEDDIALAMQREPGLKEKWDEKYGDRMQKIVFIGQKLDKVRLQQELDACLAEETDLQ